MMIRLPVLDPRTKLLFVILVSSLAVFVQYLPLMLIIFVICFVAAAAAGADLWGLLKKSRHFIFLFIAMVFLQSIFTQRGQMILQIGGISVLTDFGLLRGTQTIMRFLIIITSTLIMTTVNSRELIQGLVQWKIPFELAFMVSIAIRFLPLFKEEVSDMLTAIQLRGVNLKRVPLFRRLKLYSYLLMPLIASVLIKSQELSVAVEMRAFRAYPGRTSLKILRFGTLDYLMMLGILAFVFSVILAHSQLT